MADMSVYSIQETLIHPEARIRWEAIDKLRAARDVPPTLVPTLIHALNDEAGKVRWRAAAAIRDHAQDARDAIPSLIQCLGDAQQWVRWHAFDALKAMLPLEELVSQFCHKLEHTTTEALRCQLAERLVQVHAEKYTSVHELVHIYSTEKNPAVKQSLAHILGNLPKYHEAVTTVLCKGAYDTDARVAAISVTALGKLASHQGYLSLPLQSMLYDVLIHTNKTIACAAAVALANHKQLNYRSLALLIDALHDRNECVPAWRAILAATSSNRIMPEMQKQLQKIPSAVYQRVIAEDAACGILPTIGMKLWKKLLPLEIPSTIQPYPFEDAGVFHSWISHQPTMNAAETTAQVIQVCIYSDWFPDVHLITLAQYERFQPRAWNGMGPPFIIEGVGIGPMIQSGGNIKELQGMRLLPKQKTDRIDMLFCRDLRMHQYLMAAGQAANMPKEQHTAYDAIAATAWEHFRSAMRQALTDGGLQQLADEQWYDREAWWSLHYKARYERPYAPLQPAILAFFDALQNNTSAMRERIRAAANVAVDKLESLLVTERLKNYPPYLRETLGLEAQNEKNNPL